MISPELAAWLSANMESYEFYVLHAMYNSLVQRPSLAPLVRPDDFSTEEHILLASALQTGVRVSELMGEPLTPYTPAESVRTYMEAAAKAEDLGPETVAAALEIYRTGILDTSYESQWHVVPACLTMWISTTRFKQYSRKAAMQRVVDAPSLVARMQSDLTAAAQAAASDEEDEMQQLRKGTITEENVARISTGIPEFDACLNGGLAAGECYGVFSGTGGGKSIYAGQVASHIALSGGWPLIVSTELTAREYIARCVSGRGNIPIPVLQDCASIDSMKYAIAADPRLAARLPGAERVINTLLERLRIKKIVADAGAMVGDILAMEYERYKVIYGVPPTVVILDWLGSIADVNASASRGTSERALAWELSANSCVRFADKFKVPTVVLFQAVNDAEMKFHLTKADYGISKGLDKGFVATVGITNVIDQASLKAAALGKGEMPKSRFLEDQLFCVTKARKGEGTFIPVRRDFLYQRFISKPRH